MGSLTTRELASELNQQENQQRGKKVVAYDVYGNKYDVTGWAEGDRSSPEFALTIEAATPSENSVL